jgi:ATP-binding cassette subfamily B protein
MKQLQHWIARQKKKYKKIFKQISKNRTTLVIAHRLSTAADADEILVLEQGEITERGNHEELLSKKGKYSEMWNKQKSSIDLIHA